MTVQSHTPHIAGGRALDHHSLRISTPLYLEQRSTRLDIAAFFARHFHLVDEAGCSPCDGAVERRDYSPPDRRPL
jgi:hypothetical protein